MRLLLTAFEVAEITGLAIQTVRGLARKGKLPMVRVGHKYLFHRDSLLQFLSTPTPPPPAKEEVTGGNGMD